MADVKWIKITTDIFSDEKILLIEQMPDADTILVIWFKLLCLAGRDNNNGIFLMNNRIPYTEEMFATIFRRPINTVRLAISTFEAFGMIDIDDNIISLTHWEKHQNIEGMNKIKEQTRQRMAEYRARKRVGITSVGQNCVYCGKPANAVDHIIPKIKGGQDVAWNLVPCCKSCNSSKKDKDLDEFLNDSFFYHYQNIDHNLVQSNEKLMNVVEYNSKQKKYTLRNNYAELPDRIDKKRIEKEIEEEKENNICDSGESASSSKKSKPVKHKHGEFQHVLLTDNEFEKLAELFGVELRDKAIIFLDEYIEDKGYKSKSHYMAIRRWTIDAVKEKAQKKKGGGRKEAVPAWVMGEQHEYDFDALEKKLLNNGKTVASNPEVKARAEALKERLGAE